MARHDGTPVDGSTRSFRRLLLAAAMLLGTLAIVQPSAPAQAAPGDTIIYGANGYGLSQVVELNLTQQTFQQVGSVARETQAVDQDPATGFVYFYEWKTTGNEFGYWNPANGSNTIVRVYNPGPGLYMKRMAFAPDGTLYVMDAKDRLFTINKTNGNITSLGQVSGLVNGQWGGTGDMAFAPDGTLYVATYRSLYTVDVATRTSTLLYSNMIDVTGVGITVWTGLAFCDGLLYASNGEQYTELSAMFSIDPATGEENLLYYTNTLFNDLTSCPATPPVPNDAPVANGGSVATDEDASVGVTLTATDGDGDPLTYAVDSQPSHGTLSGTAPNLTYTPAANWNGVDSFTFHANDGQANSNTATVTVTVNPVNDAPVAAGQSVVTSEDTPVAVTLAGSDVDGDSLSYAVDSQPSNGTLSGTAPNLTYTPDPGFSGSDSFTFHADDGLEDSNIATVAITVTEQNEVPVANDASVTTDEDVALGVTLTGTDGDGDPLTYAVDSQPSHGTLSGTAPNLTYTPDADSNGVDSFTFHADDGVESSNTATVTITVNPVNDAPVVGDQSAGTSENTPTGITLAATDIDGDPLTYAVDSQPTSGTLSGTAPNLTYTPDPGTSGVDSFTFHANDGSVDSNTATVTVTVDEVNDVPVASDRSVATDEDAAVGVTLTATDGDGDPLTYAVDSQPSNGTLSGAAPNLTYTPDANWNGVDSFTFHANDGAADSNTATVTITVAAVNDAPVATGSSAATDQDVAVGVALSAADVDGDPLTYVVGSPPSNGTLSGTAPNLTYTPAPGWHGVDSFTFRANDGSENSNTATVTITVDEVVSDLVMYAPSRTAAMTEINVTQGTVQQVPGLSFGTHAMDTDPATGLAYYFEWNTNGYRFARWDPVTRTNTTIRTYSPAPGFFATQMAFAPDGTLYMIDSSARLRTIDKVTGALTDRGAISGMVNGPYGQVGDLAIAPNGTAYVATYGNLYSLNLATRAATLLHSNMFGTPTKVWLGLAFCDGTLYGSNVDGTTNRSSIYTINPTTGATSVVHNLSVYVTDLTACV